MIERERENVSTIMNNIVKFWVWVTGNWSTTTIASISKIILTIQALNKLKCKKKDRSFTKLDIHSRRYKWVWAAMSTPFSSRRTMPNPTSLLPSDNAVSTLHLKNPKGGLIQVVGIPTALISPTIHKTTSYLLSILVKRAASPNNSIRIFSYPLIDKAERLGIQPRHNLLKNCFTLRGIFNFHNKFQFPSTHK